MTERRRFNARERAALYLAADGRCTSCGVELEPGWHADHVQPHAHGGPTDVINGQALCPTCNLIKGDRVSRPLRPWQARALREYTQSTQENFLVEATPGAGKTTFALTVARRLLDEGAISRVIVVCPTAHLKRQWAKAALKFDIQLDKTFINKNLQLSPDYHGAAITYASVDSGPLIVRRLCAVRTLVILDEVHHCGEDGRSAWGRALRVAFEGLDYGRRLLLSGTPFRSTGDEIPFVRYENDIAVPDYRYDYPAALTDGVCRPVEFLAYDGEMQWREVSGKNVTSLLSTANNEKDERKAFRSALLPDGAWMADVLTAADRHLTRTREEIPDAGGLVVARDKAAARAYAELLRVITGQEPIVVLSRDDGEDDPDLPDPSKEIERFSDDPSRRWIIAVMLVSEGVDIPRLAVGVYATNKWTEMLFRQIVGRFVRLRTEGEAAAVFLPSVGTLLKLAARVADEADTTLREQSERIVGDLDDDGHSSGELPFSEPLTSGAASEHSRISNGESVTPEEIEANRPLRARFPGIKGTDTDFALFVREMRGAPPAGTVPQAASTTPEPIPVEQKLRALRNRVNKAARRYALNTGQEYGVIYTALSQAAGARDKVATASIASLEKRLAVLREWGENA